MKRRALLLAAGALATPLVARGQSRRIPQMGVLVYSDVYLPYMEGMRAGLKELGLVEGRDLTLDMFNAKGDLKALDEAARRFEREQATLIWAAPTSSAIVVKRTTSSIPVVFCVGSDPAAAGLVRSFAKPGGRFTGVHYLTADLTAKRLEVLKELLPKMTRVVVVYNPQSGPAMQSLPRAREAGAKLHIELVERHVRSQADLRAAAAALKAGDADAFFYLPDAMVATHLEAIIERAKVIRLPTMVHDEGLAERGALTSYGIDSREVGRQSAKHVQRVLSGSSPADLPVENVTRIVFALNRRTAREIGLRVPREMLARFDRVIE